METRSVTCATSPSTSASIPKALNGSTLSMRLLIPGFLDQLVEPVVGRVEVEEEHRARILRVADHVGEGV